MSIELTTENLALKARVQGLERKVDLLEAENERLRTTRPEPSRLEIIKDIYCANIAAGYVGILSNVPIIAASSAREADALIAAAKGGE